MKPGDHGSTFAGGPLVCHAALAVLDRVTEEGFLDNVVERGEQLRGGLREALKDNAHVKEVRGSGLLVGVQLDVPAAPLVGMCRDAGLLVITAGAGQGPVSTHASFRFYLSLNLRFTLPAKLRICIDYTKVRTCCFDLNWW